MKKILLITFLSTFGMLFSQQTERNHNLIVAFDSSLKLDREKIKTDLIHKVSGFSVILENYDFELNYSFVFQKKNFQKWKNEP